MAEETTVLEMGPGREKFPAAHLAEISTD